MPPLLLLVLAMLLALATMLEPLVVVRVLVLLEPLALVLVLVPVLAAASVAGPFVDVNARGVGRVTLCVGVDVVPMVVYLPCPTVD